MVGGYVSLLCSIGKKPLDYWSKRQSQTGHVRRILDTELYENVVEIQDLEPTSIANTSIICPSSPRQFLNIALPFMVIVIKYMNVDCRFQLQVTDTERNSHRFVFCSEESEKDLSTRASVVSRVNVKLQSGWNKLELDLRQLTTSAFRCEYKTARRLEICANCRLRRVYFIDRHYGESEISPELCQGFLDLYMAKWGIHLEESSTQTRGLSGRDRKHGSPRNASPSKLNSLQPGGKEKVTARAYTSGSEFLQDFSTGQNLRFLKSLQSVCAKSINDFLRSRRIKESSYLDLARKLRPKKYILPSVDVRKQKTMSSGLISKCVGNNLCAPVSRKSGEVDEGTFLKRYEVPSITHLRHVAFPGTVEKSSNIEKKLKKNEKETMSGKDTRSNIKEPPKPSMDSSLMEKYKVYAVHRKQFECEIPRMNFKSLETTLNGLRNIQPGSKEH